MPDKEVTLKPGESVKITVPASKNPRPCLRKGDRVRLDGMFGTVESIEDMHGIWVDLEIGRRKQLTLCRYCELELIPAKPAPLSRFKPGDRVEWTGSCGLRGTVTDVTDLRGIWVWVDNGPTRFIPSRDLELVSAPATRPCPFKIGDWVTMYEDDKGKARRVCDTKFNTIDYSYGRGEWEWQDKNDEWRSAVFVKHVVAHDIDKGHAEGPAPALPGEWRDYPDANGLWLCYKNGRPGVAILVVVTNRPQAFHQDWRILSFRTPIQHDPAHRWLRLPDAPPNA